MKNTNKASKRGPSKLCGWHNGETNPRSVREAERLTAVLGIYHPPTVKK